MKACDRGFSRGNKCQFYIVNKYAVDGSIKKICIKDGKVDGSKPKIIEMNWYVFEKLLTMIRDEGLLKTCSLNMNNKDWLIH